MEFTHLDFVSDGGEDDSLSLVLPWAGIELKLLTLSGVGHVSQFGNEHSCTFNSGR